MRVLTGRARVRPSVCLSVHSKTGLVSVDKAGSAELRDIAASLGRAGVQYETLSAPTLRSRYPCLSFDDSFGAVFDPTAGILRADKCLAAFQVQYDRSENAYRCLRVVCALRRGYFLFPL